MKCLWCKDENKATDLIKKLASTETEQRFFEKALPDLFHCLDCVHAYHKLKDRFNWSPEAREDLLSIEHERILHHLKEVYKGAAELKHRQDVSLEKLNNFRRPILEVLMYPYLMLKKEIMENFILVLEQLIDYDKNIIEIDYKCPTVYLLLINSSHKIRRWSINTVGKLHVAEIKDLCLIKPVISAMLNILIFDLVDANRVNVPVPNEMVLTTSTKLPDHMFENMTKKEVWIACRVMFNTLQSRILRTLLMGKNKKFLLTLVSDLHENHDMFWTILEVIHILLDKLGSSFWLLPNNVDSPTLLFCIITEHSLFVDCREKASLVDFYDSPVSCNKGNGSDDGTPHHDTLLDDATRSYSTQLFSWILPFLTSMIGFETLYCDTMDQIFLFYVDLLDNYLKTSELFSCASQSFITILTYLSNINRMVVFASYANKFANILFNLSLCEEKKTKLADSAICFINMVIDHGVGLKLIEKTQKSSFHVNFKRMLRKQSYDRHAITSIIASALKISPELKEEMMEDSREDAFQKIRESLSIGTANVPILIDDNDVNDDDNEDDDDDDDDEANTEKNDDANEGASSVVYTYKINEKDSGNKQMKMEEENMENCVKQLHGYTSPIQISDDDDDDDDNLDDFVVSSNTDINLIADSVFENDAPCQSSPENGAFKIISDFNDPKCNKELPQNKNVKYISMLSSGKHSQLKSKKSFDFSHIDKQKGCKSKLCKSISNPAILSSNDTTSFISSQKERSSSVECVKVNKRICKDVDSAKARLQKCSDKLKAKPWKNNLLAGTSSWYKKGTDYSYSDDNVLLDGHIHGEGIFYDISSNLKGSSKAKTVQASNPLPNVKLKSVNLRRERIENELSNIAKKPSFAMSGPNLCSEKSYTLYSVHTMLLSWEPSWLDSKNYQVEMLKKLNPIPNMFDCYDNYMDIFWPLLFVETWAYMKTEWESSEHVCVTYKLDSVDEHQTDKKSCHIKCTYSEEGEGIMCHTFPTTDDLLLLTFCVDSNAIQRFGIVTHAHKVCQKSEKRTLYTLRIKLNTVSIIKTLNKVSVTNVASLSFMFRQWTGLIGLQNSLLASDILKPYRRKTYCLEMNDIKRKGRLEKLNSKQFQVASAVTRAVATEFSTPKIRLVQGPPGTGKSYTLKAIITHLLEDWACKGTRSEESVVHRSRLLVCAPTNTAIDEIIKRLISSPPWVDELNKIQSKDKNCGDFNLIRLGGKEQVDKDLYHFTLEYLVSSQIHKHLHENGVIHEELQKISVALDALDVICLNLKMSPGKTNEYVEKMCEHGRLQRHYDKLSRKYAKMFGGQQEDEKCERFLLLNADIIFSTLSDVGSKCMLQTFKDNIRIPFKCLFIDDAHKCSEPQTLIPIQYGVSKLVLIGDPSKLTVAVNSEKASQCNLGQSLFSRLHCALVQNNVTKPVITLHTQYRMLPEICSFPSKRFFQNKLKSVKEIIRRDEIFPLKSYVVLKLVVDGTEENEITSAHSLCVRRHCTAICESISQTTISLNAVGVIVADKEQVNLLSEQLESNDLGDILVDTADRFQGREKEVVVVSCVREPTSTGTNSFLLTSQGLNIALTRAKQSLIILGCCKGLECNDDWSALVHDAKSRRVLYDVTTVDETLDCIYSRRWKESSNIPNEAGASPHSYNPHSTNNNEEVGKVCEQGKTFSMSSEEMEVALNKDSSKRKTLQTDTITHTDVIDCDAIYCPYISGELIDSLVAKDEIDLAIEIDTPTNEDNGEIIEGVNNGEEEVVNEGKDSERDNESNNMKEDIVNVTQPSEMNYDKKIKSKKRKKTNKIICKPNVAVECEPSDASKVLPAGTKVLPVGTETCSVGATIPCFGTKVSSVSTKHPCVTKESSQGKNVSCISTMVSFQSAEIPCITTNVSTVGTNVSTVSTNVSTVSTKMSCFSEQLFGRTSPCTVVIQDIRGKKEGSRKNRLLLQNESNDNYVDLTCESSAEESPDLPEIKVETTSYEITSKEDVPEDEKEVHAIVIQEEGKGDLCAIHTNLIPSQSDDFICTEETNVARNENIIVPISAMERERTLGLNKCENVVCTAAGDAFQTCAVLVQSHKQPSSSHNKEIIRASLNSLGGRRYFTDAKALPQNEKLEETVDDMPHTHSGKLLDDLSNLDMDISEEEGQPIVVEDVIVQNPPVQTTFQYSVLGRISDCKDVGTSKPKPELNETSSTCLNSEGDHKTKNVTEAEESTGKKKKKKKHKHKSKHKKTRKEKKGAHQVTSSDVKSIKSNKVDACMNMDIDPIFELEEIVKQNDEAAKERETKEKEKKENVKLFLSIKLLTKEKLTCNDPEKSKTLTEALDKLENLITLQKEKESNNNCTNVPESSIHRDQDGVSAATVTRSTIPCNESDNVADMQTQRSEVSPLPDPRRKLLSPPQPPQSPSPTAPLTTNLRLQTPPTPPSITPPHIPHTTSFKRTLSTDISNDDSSSDILDSPLFDSIFNFQSPTDSPKPSPLAGKKAGIGDVRHDVLPHTHKDGFICTEICRDARTEPSGAYFKFPHRHSDGFLCTVKCERLIHRERWKKDELLAKIPRPQQPVDIPWRLVPLDLPLTRAERAALLPDPRVKDDPGCVKGKAHVNRTVKGDVNNVEEGNRSTYVERNDFKSENCSEDVLSVAVNPAVSSVPPMMDYGDQKDLPFSVTGNISLLTCVNNFPTNPDNILSNVSLTHASSDNFDGRPSPVPLNSSNPNLPAPNNFNTESDVFPMKRSDVELVIRTFEGRVPGIGPVTPTIDEPIALATNEILNKCDISATTTFGETMGCSLGVVHSEPPICLVSTTIVDNPIKRQREGTPTLDEPLISPPPTHMLTTVGACAASNEAVSCEASRTLLNNETEKCPSFPPYVSPPPCTLNTEDSILQKSGSFVLAKPSCEQFQVSGKDVHMIGLIQRDSASGSDMDIGGTSSDGNDTSVTLKTKNSDASSANQIDTCINVQRDSGSVDVFGYKADNKDEVTSHIFTAPDLSMSGEGGRCCTPTRDESTNPLVQLSREGAIEEQQRVIESVALNLNQSMNIDPVMVPRLKEMGSAQALSFAIKNDGANAVPYVIKQALVSNLEDLIKHLPQIQQQSVVNYALGYFTALVEKFLTKGDSNSFFQHVPNMMNLAVRNAREAYLQSVHSIEESNVVLTVAHSLPCPPITDHVGINQGAKINHGFILPSDDTVDSDVDRLVSHFRNTCDSRKVQRIEAAPGKSEETGDGVNRSISSSRSPDGKDTPPIDEEYDSPLDATLPKQKTKQTYGPKLPPVRRERHHENERNPDPTSYEEKECMWKRKGDYSPERYSDDLLSNDISNAELPKQTHNRHSDKRSYRRKDLNTSTFNGRTSDVKSKKRQSRRHTIDRDGRMLKKNDKEKSFTQRLENAYIIEDNHILPPPFPPFPHLPHNNEFREDRGGYSEGRNDFQRRSSYDDRHSPRSQRRYQRSESEDFSRNPHKKRVRFDVPNSASSDEMSDPDEDRGDGPFVNRPSKPKRGRRYSWL